MKNMCKGLSYVNPIMFISIIIVGIFMSVVGINNTAKDIQYIDDLVMNNDRVIYYNIGY